VPDVRIAIALALSAVALPALAGPAEEERAMALQLARRDGEEAEKRGDLAACAAAYLRAFDIDSRTIGDELLYNAGVCFAGDAEVDRALDAWRRLARLYPRSRLRPRALSRIGSLCVQVARYEEAAAAFEEYADLYGGEKDAPDALMEAARFRAALRQTAHAVRLIDRWLRLGKRRKEDAAAAKAWIAALRAGPRPPPPTPQRLPERYDRRGVAGDILMTAPLAP
jgi:TolA-binding protein